MKKLSSKLLLMITAFMIFMTPALTKVSAEEVDTSTNELVILHTNDMHGQIDTKYQELAYLKAYKEHVGAAAIFDAGDASQGLPINNINQGSIIGEIMEMIGYDAMAIGNHEFDYTLAHVLGTVDGFFKSSPNVPKLGTNMYFTADSTTGPQGQPVFGPNSTSIQIQLTTTGGDTITASVYGLATPETKVKADPRNSEGIEFRDPIPALETEIAKDENVNSDLHIVLGHLGTDMETIEPWRAQTVAKTLESNHADKKFVLIDGHSHTAHEDAFGYASNVVYGQTGGALSSIGEIRIDWDEFTNSTAKLVPTKTTVQVGNNKETIINPELAALTPDAGVVAKIMEADSYFEEETKTVVMENNPIEFEGDRKYARTRETNLGNLISDSMYEYGMDTFRYKPHVAVMNGGGIRASLPKGRLTLKDIITVMPYGNRLVQIDVSGADIKAMYEHALKAAIDEENVDSNGLPLLQSDPAILHSSDSIRVKFDPRRPAGDRVHDIMIIDHDLNELVPLDETKTYKVVTLEFLAVGGDGFSMLGGAREEGTVDSEAFSDFLSKADKDPDFDWTPYDASLEPYRVAPTAFTTDTQIEELEAVIADAQVFLDNSAKYTDETVAVLKAAVETAEAVVANAPVTEAEYNEVLAELKAAMTNMKLVETTPVKPDPKPEPDKDKEKTPGTGIEMGFPIASGAIAVLAAGGYLVLRKKED